MLSGDPAIEVPARRRSLLAELPALIGAALLIAFVVKSFVAQAFFIPSGSMIPTLEVDDRVVVSRLAYQVHEPRRGDVVVFEAPPQAVPRQPDGDRALPVEIVTGFLETVGLRQPSTQDFIKRVVGLPGETVDVRDGRVFIDGRPLDEPYLDGVPTDARSGADLPLVVPEGHLFVMGDNRGASRDSRVFGPIDQDSVVGRAVMRVWPPWRVGFL